MLLSPASKLRLDIARLQRRPLRRRRRRWYGRGYCAPFIALAILAFHRAIDSVAEKRPERSKCSEPRTPPTGARPSRRRYLHQHLGHRQSWRLRGLGLPPMGSGRRSLVPRAERTSHIWTQKGIPLGGSRVEGTDMVSAGDPVVAYPDVERLHGLHPKRRFRFTDHPLPSAGSGREYTLSVKYIKSRYNTVRPRGPANGPVSVHSGL